MTDADFMQLAIAAAEVARGRTTPNPVVGCVIVNGGKVVATGHHAKAGLAHAEVAALQQLGARAKGAQVFVTLEPCNHEGRTGPCTEALIAAGVRRVVVGMRDPNPRVSGGGVEKLRASGIEVTLGVLEAECQKQNEAFTHYITRGTPFVVVKTATSLDGRVATATGESKWITGEQARVAGHVLRNHHDVIMVGVGTVLADDPELTCRAPNGRDPLRVIVDTHARTPPKAKVARLAGSSSAGTLILVGASAPEKRVRALQKAGAEVVRVKEQGGRVALKAALTLLAKRELVSVLVEGGPTLVGSLFDQQLVQRLHTFIAPKVIGGARALSAILGTGAKKLARAPLLIDAETKQHGPDLEITGRIAYP